jgi:multidrug resistance efflux pump
MDHDHRVAVSPEGGGSGPSLKERVRSLRLPLESTQRSRGSSRSVLLLSLVCLGLAVLASYLGFEYYRAADRLAGLEKSNPRPREDYTHPGDAKSVGDGTGGSIASSGEVALERKGYIIPAHQILISPKVAGMIESLNIEEGKHVKKGEILAQLETVDYQADHDHCVANFESCWQKWLELFSGNRPQEIKAAKARLDEMDAQKEQLYLDFKRNTRLTGTNAVAVKDYEQAVSAYRAMERRSMQMRQDYELMLEGPRPEKIDAAWADVLQAGADVAKAKWRLDNCSIRAPIAGTILIKRAELGNLVNPIAMQGSTSLCEMADLADLEVDLNIEERDIARVFKGQTCKIRPEAYPERVYEGVVARLMPQADRSKSAIPVRVKVKVPKEEEGVYLKPEMGVVVGFQKKASPRILSNSHDAVANLH